MSHFKRNTPAYLRHCHVPGSSAPPGWEKFWWFAVCIQYDNQRKLQKKAPPILFGKNSRPADSFISENEGMNQNKDSSFVACADKKERDLVREHFLKKKLGLTLDDAALDQAVMDVCANVHDDRDKSRVTFYYLLAERFDKLAMFH